MEINCILNFVGGPLVTVEDNLLVGVANWVIPCGKGYPGQTNLRRNSAVFGWLSILSLFFKFSNEFALDFPMNLNFDKLFQGLRSFIFIYIHFDIIFLLY